MIDPTIKQLQFKIDSLVNWAKYTDKMVDQFKRTFGVYPNALVANQAMLSRIDMAAAAEHDEENLPVSNFIGDDYQLDLLMNDEVPDNHLVLVYETTGGDGEGEELPKIAYG